jgi:hypothetical protein
MDALVVDENVPTEHGEHSRSEVARPSTLT